jgi:hypothetical protein
MVKLDDVNERLVEPGIACSRQMVCVWLPRKRKHAAFILGSIARLSWGMNKSQFRHTPVFI